MKTTHGKDSKKVRLKHIVSYPDKYNHCRMRFKVANNVKEMVQTHSVYTII